MTATKRTALHQSFAIERTYNAPPARAYAAFADAEAKRRWCFCHSAWPVEHELDFRVGGRETIRTGPAGGTIHLCEAVYHDIIANERIVYSYAMHLDERRISVSLVTVEFNTAPNGGTRLVFTEQGAYLDGWEDVTGREHGTRLGLDNLADELHRPQAA